MDKIMKQLAEGKRLSIRIGFEDPNTVDKDKEIEQLKAEIARLKKLLAPEPNRKINPKPTATKKSKKEPEIEENDMVLTEL